MAPTQTAAELIPERPTITRLRKIAAEQDERQEAREELVADLAFMAREMDRLVSGS